MTLSNSAYDEPAPDLLQKVESVKRRATLLGWLLLSIPTIALIAWFIFAYLTQDDINALSEAKPVISNAYRDLDASYQLPNSGEFNKQVQFLAGDYTASAMYLKNFDGRTLEEKIISALNGSGSVHSYVDVISQQNIEINQLKQEIMQLRQGANHVEQGAVPESNCVQRNKDTICRVYFDVDGKDPSLTNRSFIKSLFEKYREDRIEKVTVIGRTDTSGPSYLNDIIAKRRASDVASVISDYFGGDIKIIPLGERNPIVSTGDNQKEPRNRVVEIVLSFEK